MADPKVDMTQVEALHVALQQSFSPDSSVRDPAEASIKHLKFIPGATQMLLAITGEQLVQYEVRQAASIQLKNICRECWVERVSYLGIPLPAIDGATNPDGTPQAPPILSEEDKLVVKGKLMECLMSEPDKSIRDLMAETLHSIAIHDFPETWPELLPTLLQTISQNADPSQALRVHNALLAMRKVCKRYEYKSREQRGPLNEIVRQSFPLILPLAQRLAGPNESSLEAAMMLKQILKIFWSSTQFYLPNGNNTDGTASSTPSPALANPNAMEPWFEVLKAVLTKPLPEADQPVSKEERNAWPWWKVKKWAAQIMTRLFSRYGIPNYAEEEVKEFAKYFSTNVAPSFLGPVCETLNLRPSGQFCTDRVVHLCLNFVDLAVELAPTYKLLKPHMDFLLYKVCFPAMCLTEEDIDEFENDPHEFVHKQNSPLADFYDPRMSAITLVTSAVKYRGQDTMQPLLGFLTEILQRYNATDEANRNHIEKDCALLMFGSLSEILLSKKKYAAELEGLMVTSVFPDFNSPVGFLRCRACWMVQRFSELPWSDDGTHLKDLIQLVLQRLSDPALPVQIEASKALRFLIEVEGADVTLLPVLPQILTEYFRIMNEIGNDEVVAALQVIIDTFGEHIEPHAIALVTQLSTAFKNYVDAGDDDDDAAMAAAQCLECINTVLKGTCEHPELYKGMEPHLIPLVLQILGNDGEYLEYVEFALDTLTFLTYFPLQLSPQLWEAFPLLYVAFENWAFDYMILMTPPLNNFISKDPRYFLTAAADMPEGSVKYIDMIFNIVSKTVQEDRSSESEQRKALSLYMSVLHNCTGQVDNYVPIINDIALAKLGQQVNAEKPTTRHAIFQVLGSALYYNPELELRELEKRGITGQVITQWIAEIDSMEGWLSQKMSVLGLVSILRLPASSLPQHLGAMIPNIIAAAVKLAVKMKDETEKGQKDDDVAIVPEAGDDDGWEGFDENEDVTNPSDEAYMSALNKLSSGVDVSQFLLGDGWDDDFDDLEDDFHSPIDNVEEQHFLNDVLKEAYQREPEVYQQVQAALPAETVASCQQLFASVDAQRSQAGPVTPSS
mmetsp:Transcript_2586/g.5551  ORF Transcript_2586/g.5551 Transcript_2586/m.5551 type:complete len:1070 (-) Transcript_2586:974-4183(-)|eukprot:CAMPEP_0172325948 /NCGR_PEP_ID=MMETSP1058-20130122/55115_1 /TAXON_ID=83371 /ORGANISM="Detonula confervacea, Strain CCMP 353" /LENGTH=1069 /DNA_ID=CAMNT_0013042609 /DNA_START=174 /DNA_END=3383 /DNA_ORIENTATION=-